MKKFILVVTVLVGVIFAGIQIYQGQKKSYELQEREVIRNIITPEKFDNITDTLTVKFRDASMIRLIAEYDLNTFVYLGTKDLLSGQDQFIRLIKLNFAKQLSFNAYKLDVTDTAYSKNRKETIIQFFSNNIDYILENSNIQYPGAMETLKITILSKGI